MDNLNQMLNSKGYMDAQTRLRTWKNHLQTIHDKDQVIAIRSEVSIYLSTMKEQNPEMFDVLAVNFKELLGFIHEKLTGQKIIID